MRKGISQVIAAVFLLAVAVSVAGIYSNWAPDTAENLAGEAGEQAENSITCSNAAIYLKSVEYDKSGNLAEVRIENTGTIAFYDDITVSTFNRSEITGSKVMTELEVDEERLVEIRSDKTPDRVVVQSDKCSEVSTSTESIDVTA